MVYVDSLRKYPRLVGKLGRVGLRWCHLWADTDQELLDFAFDIGLKGRWFQRHHVRNHFDLTWKKRELAVAAGAVEKEFIEWLREQRDSEQKHLTPVGGVDTR